MMKKRRKPIARKRSVARRKSTVRRSSFGKTGRKAAGIIVPLLLIGAIVSCLSYLLVLGYRSAAASSFFDMTKIEVRGVSNASQDEIEALVGREASATGVWKADLAAIKRDVEGLAYVKTAAVSRVLPGTVRVIVFERQPRAVVRLAAGDVWVDDEGVQLGPATDGRPPFVMKGWDESKTLAAIDENRERVRLYMEMLSEWSDFQLSRRVTEVDLRDLREVRATVIDSGEPVTINLGSGDFGMNLREALKKVATRGREIRSFDVATSVASPRNS